MVSLNNLEKTILEDVCKNEIISVVDIENLLEIEKEYELAGRKSGRIDRIKDYITNQI